MNRVESRVGIEVFRTLNTNKGRAASREDLTIYSVPECWWIKCST